MGRRLLLPLCCFSLWLAAFSLAGFLQGALEHSYGPLNLASENGPVQAIGNLANVTRKSKQNFCW